MSVGELLRDWRQRRHLSQLDLAGAAEVSARHLSFVETGRSKPSRELLIHLAGHLEVPLRERNALLLAAGYAPAYRETPLDDATMGPVNDALEKILKGHEPFPAVIINRRWELVRANAPLLALMQGVDPALLEPPINVLRVSLHPDGVAPRIGNLAEWSAHLLTRLRREAMLSADPALGDLYDELREYPGVVEGSDADVTTASMLFVPLEIDGMKFFSTVATFGTALDVTLAELSIESFYPAG